MSEKDVFSLAERRMAASGLRLNNERAVLTTVILHPGYSAAKISRVTGLGPQSVSRILVELEAADLVRRGQAQRGKRGQPAVPIFINPDGAFCVGCEIGWRRYHVLMRNIAGEVLFEEEGDYPYPDPDTLIQLISASARRMVERLPKKHQKRVSGLGVAMPGSFHRNVDLVGGKAETAVQWRDIDMQERLSEASGLDVLLINDGNAACWAELVVTPPPRPPDFAYLLVGEFVGAGLVAGGRLWDGPTGNSADLGAMLVSDGKGNQTFVHLIASIFALQQRLKEAGMKRPEGHPYEWDWERLEPVASTWIKDAGLALAKTIINANAVADFERAVVDGIMPRPIVERLVDSVRSNIEALPILAHDHPAIEIGRLGRSAPALGAALRPMFHKFFSREFEDIANEKAAARA
ncbi:sugar kinase [Devosia pacifica]|uniref:Sugar kinase n=1 Tax=Devosia pacifica TaxID=1335967 RepID=A0A918VRB4_9HYPH|nr:ROK family transcriptional regulator [Devosia pacifica]GHA18308.1 sugar kinase [Devosia pacifica]